MVFLDILFPLEWRGDVLKYTATSHSYHILISADTV